jgi:transaldolase/glucose-6-phosphate isomerase
MNSNSLKELARHGQSIWYDQLSRSLVTSGTLARFIAEDGLRGMTSNPAIFEKSISGGEEYLEPLTRLAEQGRSAMEIYEALALEDVRAAADVFRPVFDETKGLDGFVSLEVNPELADDTRGTIDEAHRLYLALDRPNVLIKVPATAAGIPAIESLIADGMNINVTLIFSIEVYATVIDAYQNGLRRRKAAGMPVDGVSSVASFFVSRIDTAIDKALDLRAASAPDPAEKARILALRGRAAIANAKSAYQLFLRRFRTPEFEALGARVQRPLWASTGTKNPDYSDVLYLDELIGPDTVNTVPPQTFEAFRDHGTVASRIETGLDEARRVLADLEALGISLRDVTTQLTLDGVKAFQDPFRSLLRTIEARRLEATRAVA